MVRGRLPGQLNGRRRSNQILGSFSRVISSNKEHSKLIDDREVRFSYIFFKWNHVFISYIIQSTFLIFWYRNPYRLLCYMLYMFILCCCFLFYFISLRHVLLCYAKIQYSTIVFYTIYTKVYFYMHKVLIMLIISCTWFVDSTAPLFWTCRLHHYCSSVIGGQMSKS